MFAISALTRARLRGPDLRDRAPPVGERRAAHPEDTRARPGRRRRRRSDRRRASRRRRNRCWASAKRIVVKVGSTLVTDDGRGLDRAAIARWAAQLAALRASRKEVVLVSSGAIAEGIKRLGWTKRPTAMHELQAAAAVGQMGLVQAYERGFAEHGIGTAQILLTHADLADRSRYLNARSTLLTLLGLGVVPIINENDTVVTDEIKFGDNDTLGALVANLIEADALVILTDQAGLYTADPRTRPVGHADRRGPRRRPRARGDGRRRRQRDRSRRDADEGARGEARRDERRAHGDRVGSRARRADAARARRARSAPSSPRRSAVCRRASSGWPTTCRLAGRLMLDAGAAARARRGPQPVADRRPRRSSARFARGDVVACHRARRTRGRARHRQLRAAATPRGSRAIRRPRSRHCSGSSTNPS